MEKPLDEQHSYAEDFENRYKFNGKELDEETGLYYYGARYYDPRTSIWLSVDPLAEDYPNWNPYNYTMQNPINLIDPTGMSSEDNDWRRGSNGELIAEAGDTALTLAEYAGISEESAIDLFQNLENWNYGLSSEAISDVEGNVLSGPYSMERFNNRRLATGACTPMGGGGDIFGVWDMIFGEVAKSSDSQGMALAFAVVTKKGTSSATTLKAINLAENIASASGGQGFRSFSAFKRSMGSAGTGQAWHHIVEQTPNKYS